MTQVKLLPPEVLQRHRRRQLSVAAVFGVAVVVALLLLVFVVQSARLSRANHTLAQRQAANQGVQAQINGLSQFQQLKQAVIAKQTLIQGLLSGQMKWSNALQDVSTIIPGQMYLTSMNGSLKAVASPAVGQGAAGQAAGIVGTITFSGFSTDEPTLAMWLTRLEGVKGWANAWLASSIQTKDPQGNTVYQFTASVDLTTAATASQSP